MEGRADLDLFGVIWCDEGKETHFIEYPNELLD
jgi:hypothetical protein